MPELPEVETVRRTLETLVLHKEIRDIDVFYEKMIRTDSVDDFKEKLIGRKIDRIDREGKHLIFVLGDLTLISHLRMEGKYFIKQADINREKHEHVIIYFTDGQTLRYHDTRKFGTMDLIKLDEIYTTHPLNKLGHEPWSELMTPAYLKRKLANRTIAVKSFLLDQSVLVGLGNIYVDEVLFNCKLHPETSCKDLKPKDLKNIITYSKSVLEKAVKLGGTTIRSYTSSLGVTGRFQNELMVHMRKDEPCKVCNTTITKIKVNGRGTYLCTKCQKKK